MRTLPADPRPGEKVSATLIRELIRAVRERTPIGGRGIHASTGPNGTVIDCTASGGRTSLPRDTGCFKISRMKIVKDDEGTVTKAHVTFANRYVMQGGNLEEVQRYDKPSQEDGEASEEDLGLDIFGKTVAAVVYEEDGAGSLLWFIKAFENLSELKNEQRDASKYVFPLYRFDEETYEVVTDFRSAPNIQVFDDAYANLDEQSEDEQ